MATRFVSNRGSFNRKHRALVDMVEGHMAMDIEVAIKTTSGTPVKTGGLKSSVRHFRSPSGGFRVEANKAYAAYQERGARADGAYRVKHYTTSGTSAGWFMRAIEGVIRNRRQYISEARRAVGL